MQLMVIVHIGMTLLELITAPSS